MLLDRIFEGEIKPNNIAKAKKIDVKFLDSLKKKAADSHGEEVSRNWETIETFYAGDQWQNIKLNRSKLSFNSLGETVFDLESTYGNLKNDEYQKPKRVVNITKSQVEALVSVFAEVDPLPVPIPTGDFEYNDELVRKLSICLKDMFTETNDFNSQYKVLVEGSLVYGHYFMETAIDKDKSDGQIPVKFRYVNPKTVVVDPEAVTLDEADYVIQTVKLKYYQLKQIYDYKWSEAIGEITKTEEPKDMDMVEIDKFYIRFKDNGKTKWLLIPKYNKDWLKYRVDKDQKDTVIVLDNLPLVIFRGKVRERWFGSSLVAEMMPSQVEYNKAVSEQDWNWRKFVDPPLQGTIDIAKVKSANKPGGYLSISGNQNVANMGNTSLIPQGEFAAREASIKQDMAEVVGSDIGTLQGRRPQGVYSSKMLETLQKAAQLKPKMWEEEFLKGVSILADKSLDLLANYIGGGSISVFDPITGEVVDITAEDIRTGTYEINVETKDANLLTKEARFEIIRDLMQYAKFQEFMPMYDIMRMVSASIPGIFPADVMLSLKKDYELFKETKKKEAEALVEKARGASVNGVPSPNPGEGQGLPPTTAPSPANTEMDDQQFQMEVQNYGQQMIDAGVPQDRVAQMVSEAVATGSSKEETLLILEELLNKSLNITGGTQYGN